MFQLCLLCNLKEILYHQLTAPSETQWGGRIEGRKTRLESQLQAFLTIFSTKAKTPWGKPLVLDSVGFQGRTEAG
jgi:hypothetical protein